MGREPGFSIERVKGVPNDQFTSVCDSLNRDDKKKSLVAQPH